MKISSVQKLYQSFKEETQVTIAWIGAGITVEYGNLWSPKTRADLRL